MTEDKNALRENDGMSRPDKSLERGSFSTLGGLSEEDIATYEYRESYRNKLREERRSNEEAQRQRLAKEKETEREAQRAKMREEYAVLADAERREAGQRAQRSARLIEKIEGLKLSVEGSCEAFSESADSFFESVADAQAEGESVVSAESEAMNESAATTAEDDFSFTPILRKNGDAEQIKAPSGDNAQQNGEPDSYDVEGSAMHSQTPLDNGQYHDLKLGDSVGPEECPEPSAVDSAKNDGIITLEGEEIAGILRVEGMFIDGFAHGTTEGEMDFSSVSRQSEKGSKGINSAFVMGATYAAGALQRARNVDTRVEINPDEEYDLSALSFVTREKGEGLSSSPDLIDYSGEFENLNLPSREAEIGNNEGVVSPELGEDAYFQPLTRNGAGKRYSLNPSSRITGADYETDIYGDTVAFSRDASLKTRSERFSEVEKYEEAVLNGELYRGYNDNEGFFTPVSSQIPSDGEGDCIRGTISNQPLAQGADGLDNEVYLSEIKSKELSNLAAVAEGWERGKVKKGEAKREEARRRREELLWLAERDEEIASRIERKTGAFDAEAEGSHKESYSSEALVRQKNQDTELIRLRYEAEIAAVRKETASAEYSFSLNARERRRKRKNSIKEINRLKRLSRLAVSCENSDNVRYYELMTEGEIGNRLNGRADPERLEALKEELLNLLEKRDVINKKLCELYRGASEEKSGGAKDLGKIEARGMKRDYRRHRSLARKMLRMKVSLAEREAIYRIMDEQVEIYGKMTKLRHVLRKQKPKGELKSDCKKELRRLSKSYRFNKKRIDRMSIRALKGAEKRNSSKRASVFGWTCILLIAGAAIIIYFYREPIWESIKGLFSSWFS